MFVWPLPFLLPFLICFLASYWLKGLLFSYAWFYKKLNMMVTFHAHGKIIFLKHLKASLGFSPTWVTCGFGRFQGEKMISPKIRERAYFEGFSWRNWFYQEELLFQVHYFAVILKYLEIYLIMQTCIQ